MQRLLVGLCLCFALCGVFGQVDANEHTSVDEKIEDFLRSNGLEMGFNTLSGEKKAQKFFQYIDGFEILIATHNENIEKLSNVVSTVSKYSDYFKKSGAKIQDEMKRIKEIINEVTDSKK